MEYNEKLYEESMKFRKFIETNFNIVSVNSGETTIFDPFGETTEPTVSITLDTGFRIKYLGYFHTKSEQLDFDYEKKHDY